MSSFVFHNKTGKIYWLIALSGICATNGSEHERRSIYRRPFGKLVFYRRPGEFSCKFTHWREWLKNGCKCNDN